MLKLVMKISALLILFISIQFSVALADSYVIGPDDVLEIKFWQDETNRLDAIVKVSQDGKISLDVIGEIDAAGKTTADLERDIVRQMSRYNQSISQTVVRITEYGYQRVYVSGQVLTPGKFAFETIPDLWTLINEAGGINEYGDLTNVMITRSENGEVELVNVSNAVSQGKIGELPKIFRGDVIEVSRLPGGLQSPATLSISPTGRNIFYVAGEVNNPGQFTLEDNIDLLDAITIAGGMTANANLESVKVVTRKNGSPQVVHYNLNKYTSTAFPRRMMIGAEDNIVVERKGGGFLGLGSVTDFVAVIGAATSAALLYETLRGE